MADKFYGAAHNAQLPQDVSVGDATLGTTVEVRIDTTVPKQRALETLEAIKNKIAEHYPQTGAN